MLTFGVQLHKSTFMNQTSQRMKKRIFHALNLHNLHLKTSLTV